MEDIIIIGGGVAGLSCLNALVDAGYSPLLIERDRVGKPKLCGEFIAPPALSLLKQWGIGPVKEIHKLTLLGNRKKSHIPFINPAGAFTRSEAEKQLAIRASNKGGRIFENTPIQSLINDGNAIHVSLASGCVITTKTVFHATGKQIKTSDLPYYGFKFHFSGVMEENTLFMFSLLRAYLGIVPINHEINNCACLVDASLFKTWGSAKAILKHFLMQNKFLKAVFKDVDIDSINMLEGFAPSFSINAPNLQNNEFWIGDTVVNFPPAIGLGFANNVTSALKTVVQYQTFNQFSLDAKQFIPLMQTGKLMHYFLQHPRWVDALSPLLNKVPHIPSYFLSRLGYC